MGFKHRLRASVLGAAGVVVGVTTGGVEAAPFVRDRNNWVEFQPDGPGAVRKVIVVAFFSALRRVPA